MNHNDPVIAETILNSVADGVFTVDTEWRITSFNAAAEKITGVRREDALGRPCCDVFRASICENECALRETQDTGRPIVNKAVYVLRPDGQRVPISISTSLLKDRSGHIVGGVETFRDLSVVEELRRKLEQRQSLVDIIGRSAVMQNLFELLPAVAASESTVVIQGASGTGKELVASAIHEMSPRSGEPFIAINCGALPDTLLESELFGHTAGAFTDARRDKPGRFALAEGGTLFLDEIGDISAAMQMRLLRVLQEREFTPLGGVTSVPTDVRVLTATNKNLPELVAEGVFREDLYYRINVMTIDLPPLRDRMEDIPLLIDHFVNDFSRLQNKDVAGVSEEVLEILMNHDFPGNVRELENIIEHAFILCSSGLIQRYHLPRGLLERVRPAMVRPPGATLQSIEAFHIADALRRHDGNCRAAAEELGIHRSTMFRKVKALGLSVTEDDPQA
ncbi:MAG: sigma 54-interacting transcriptional regulator [Thermoanaerobaculales bacterium]|jgi:PAS domain S-box-containing protein|nr:sigma 54-interacting transcriptional regulator [Thermoanaerobaculales bacterium]